MGRGLPRQPHHSIICSPDSPGAGPAALLVAVPRRGSAASHRLFFRRGTPTFRGRIGSLENMMSTSALLAFAFVAATLGGMIFFVSAVAPSVFKVLPQAEGGRFLRALFQKYYVVFAVSSLL